MMEHTPGFEEKLKRAKDTPEMTARMNALLALIADRLDAMQVQIRELSKRK